MISIFPAAEQAKSDCKKAPASLDSHWPIGAGAFPGATKENAVYAIKRPTR